MKYSSIEIFFISSLSLFAIASSSQFQDGRHENILSYSEPEISGCAALGYGNSTLNKCGYCIGPSTGLPPDHGMDCTGK